MPRGNDAQLIGSENAQRFGQEFLNAEDLIRSNNARFDPALQKVLARGPRPGDEDATNEVLANLAKYEDKFDLRDGETLVSAAVHGDALVGIIEDEAGRHRKAIVGYTESFEMPRLTADEQKQADTARAESEVAAETEKVRRHAEERVRLAQETAEREADEEIAKIKAAAAEKVEGARAQAESAPLPGSTPLPAAVGGSENEPVSPDGGEAGAQVAAQEAIAVADAARGAAPASEAPASADADAEAKAQKPAKKTTGK